LEELPVKVLEGSWFSKMKWEQVLSMACFVNPLREY
jgi:hypothetical protein